MTTQLSAPPVRAQQATNGSEASFCDFTTLDDTELISSVIRYYHDCLKKSAQALRHLATRGITDSETIERFQIGFVDRTLSHQLPSSNIKTGSEIRQRLKSIGMLKSSGHELFRGCLVVPFFDDNGHVVQMYGHRIDSRQKGTAPDLWLFEREAFELSDEIKQSLGTFISNPKQLPEEQPPQAVVQSVTKAEPTENTHQSGAAVNTAAGGSISITFDTRSYRVRGLDKNKSTHQMKVNVLATRDDLVHMDTLDLCKARSRTSFIKATASELFVDESTIKKDIGKLLLELEQIQQDQIEAATSKQPKVVELTDAERAEALDFLRSDNFVNRILKDYDACGLVGEESNKLVCYLAAISRSLKAPLAVLIQSGSAAGKTSLMDATLSFVPDEHQIRYSAMTGQSLYYMGSTDLAHKILAVAEEEGVSQASYALKLLQSDGTLRIAAAGRNSGTGRQETETYEVEGPVMMFLTTTNEKPDPELQNRCITLHVNESPDQTAAIHERQRAAYTLNGSAGKQNISAIRTLHQNAQRLIEPLPVVIPWAEELTFRSDQTTMRRRHQQYLSLIASITLLHQHQRPKKQRTVDGEASEYLESTIADVQLANRLASDVMGQTLDNLLPQTRHLLVLIDDHINQRCQKEQQQRNALRFTQRELRESLSWGDFQLRSHLGRLLELEYVLPYRTDRGNQREYQLVYNGEGRNGERFVLGLTDPSQLPAPT